MSDETVVNAQPPAVPETVVATPQTPPVETGTPPQFSFLDFARESGYPVDSFDSDEAAAKAFIQHARQLETEVFQRRQPEPEPPKEQPEPEEWTLEGHFSKLWGVPQYDASWDEVLTVNPTTGQIEAKSHIPWGVAQQAMADYTKWQQARSKHMKDLFEAGNPYQRMYEALKPAFERDMQAALQQNLQQEFSGRETNQVIDAFEAQHSQWLSSKEGEAFVSYAQELVQQDGLNPVRAIQIASRAFQPKANQAAPPPAAPTEQTPPPEPPKPNKEEKEASFIEDATRKAGHSPSSGTPSPSPGEPGFRDPDSVRSTFTRSYRQSQTVK